MIKLSDLPVDVNGITQGVWRLVHVDPTFSGGLGPIQMRDGVALDPVAGRSLRCIVAEYGGKLFVEPWGPLPPSYTLPELVKATVSDEQLAKLERAPWRDAAADACMPLTLELIKLGGEGGPADFARAMAEVPDLSDAELQAVRALYLERVSTLRADGYVEIPKALEGALATIDARIAALSITSADAPKPKRGTRLPRT